MYPVRRRIEKSSRLMCVVAESAEISMFTKYSIRIGERVINVSMETKFWDALRDIAAGRNTTLSALLKQITAKIDHNVDGRRLVSVLRVYILEQFIRSELKGHAEHKRKGDVLLPRPNLKTDRRASASLVETGAKSIVEWTCPLP
jgi:predicted DNA-binding ribbon-helix-helix protein